MITPKTVSTVKGIVEDLTGNEYKGRIQVNDNHLVLNIPKSDKVSYLESEGISGMGWTPFDSKLEGSLRSKYDHRAEVHSHPREDDTHDVLIFPKGGYFKPCELPRTNE